jgi:hypothetical protein
MNDGDQLRRLLSDAVSDIEPHDRLAEIQASVRSDPKVVPTTGSGSWIAAIVGTAAVIGVVAYATGTIPGMDHGRDQLTPIAHPQQRPHDAKPAPTPTPSHPTGSPPLPGTPGPGATAYAVYYVGSNPWGRPVLFREFHQGPKLPDNLAGRDQELLHEAVAEAVGGKPLDPDYVSPWAGIAALTDASYTTGADSSLHIELSGHDLAARPTDMTAPEAKAAVQQLVYTAQAALGKRVPVSFGVNHKPPTTLLGVDISKPVANAPVLRTLSLVNISTPNDGSRVSGRLHVTGVNNGFEGTVVVYLQRNGRKYLVSPTIGGMGGNRMWPWTVTLDTSKVAPGTYTLVARDDDPSGKGHPPIDTRTVVVQ